jgi:hypothetical protein
MEQDVKFVFDELTGKLSPIKIQNKDFKGEVSYGKIWQMAKDLGLKQRGPVYMKVIDMLKGSGYHVST